MSDPNYWGEVQPEYPWWKVLLTVAGIVGGIGAASVMLWLAVRFVVAPFGY